MNRVVKLVIALVVVAALVGGGFALHEHHEQSEVKKLAKRECASLDVVTGSPTLPAGVTLPSDEKLMKVESQGKTSIVYASTDGVIGDVVKIRDAVLVSLAAQGHPKTGTDQEAGIEAEGQFGGNPTGSIKIRPLCTGRLEVRYTFRG